MSSPYKIRIIQNEHAGFEKARLQISVGQPYHEGEKFLAAAEWVAQNFKSTSVNLCDSLQRHNNVYFGYSPFEAFNKAITDGDAWLVRNSKALSLLPNLEITRWEQWKERPEWPAAWQTTKSLYAQNREFMNSVETSVENFWLRKQGMPGYPEEKKQNFVEASRQYILEEVAISFVMTRSDTVEVYPGTFIAPLVYLRDNKILPDLAMTSIRFMKKTAFKKAA